MRAYSTCLIERVSKRLVVEHDSKAVYRTSASHLDFTNGCACRQPSSPTRDPRVTWQSPRRGWGGQCCARLVAQRARILGELVAVLEGNAAFAAVARHMNTTSVRLHPSETTTLRAIATPRRSSADAGHDPNERSMRINIDDQVSRRICPNGCACRACAIQRSARAPIANRSSCNLGVGVAGLN